MVHLVPGAVNRFCGPDACADSPYSGTDRWNNIDLRDQMARLVAGMGVVLPLLPVSHSLPGRCLLVRSWTNASKTMTLVVHFQWDSRVSYARCGQSIVAN